MQRVLILTADSGEEVEVYSMLYRLRETGYEVAVAAPQRRRLQLVVHDFESGADTSVERPGRGLEADLAFADVDPGRYAGVPIPGGRAPEAIRNDPDVRRIVCYFFDADLPVVHGRKVSAFPPLRPDVEAAGGEFVEAADVVDGDMVSATGWPDLAEWSKAFMTILERSPVPA